ncbi:MAG: hypothetical protein U5N58_00925 [Actinomycetota bacterium]|nr:hypothetical protein [Actinomycetota bacterium]
MKKFSNKNMGKIMKIMEGGMLWFIKIYKELEEKVHLLICKIT